MVERNVLSKVELVILNAAESSIEKSMQMGVKMDLSLSKEIRSILENYVKGLKVTENIKIKDLRIDSLNMIRVIVEIEARFQIKFETEKLGLDEFPEVIDLIDYVNEKMEER